MKFRWFEPSTRKAIKILFKAFTPEEMAILDGEDCFVPHMYSRLLKASSRISSSAFGIEDAKHGIEILFRSPENRADVRDPKVQEAIYLFFSHFLQWR